MNARRGLDCAGSYASWLAGDNLAPASMTSVMSGVSGRRASAGVAANGGSATLAMRKFGAALKVRLPLTYAVVANVLEAVRSSRDFHAWGLSYSRDVGCGCGSRAPVQEVLRG